MLAKQAKKTGPGRKGHRKERKSLDFMGQGLGYVEYDPIKAEDGSSLVYNCRQLHIGHLSPNFKFTNFNSELIG